MLCISVAATVSPGSHARSAISAGRIEIIATRNHRSQQLCPSLRAPTYKYAESSTQESIGALPTDGSGPFKYHATAILNRDAVSVTGPGGTNFYYTETAGMDATATYYPCAGILSSLQATTDTLYLSKFEIEVWQ